VAIPANPELAKCMAGIAKCFLREPHSSSKLPFVQIKNAKMEQLRIVLLENRADDVFLLEYALKKEGISFCFEVFDEAEKIIDHLSKLGGAPLLPHLIILDINLPGKNGYEVLQWIKSQSHLNSIPVLVYSWSQWPQDREKALRLGANKYFVKDSEIKDMAKSIQKFDESF
jgi:DNA-binding response OmpR family regulator